MKEQKKKNKRNETINAKMASKTRDGEKWATWKKEAGTRRVIDRRGEGERETIKRGRGENNGENLRGNLLEDEPVMHSPA